MERVGGGSQLAVPQPPSLAPRGVLSVRVCVNIVAFLDCFETMHFSCAFPSTVYVAQQALRKRGPNK